MCLSVQSAPTLRRNRWQFKSFQRFPSEPFPSPRGLALRLLQAGLLARLLPPPTPSHALFRAQWLLVGFVWLTAAGGCTGSSAHIIQSLYMLNRDMGTGFPFHLLPLMGARHLNANGSYA